jgi:hypothetical protein
VTFELEVEGVLDFQVQAGKSGEAAGCVALADVAPVGIDL